MTRKGCFKQVSPAVAETNTWAMRGGTKPLHMRMKHGAAGPNPKEAELQCRLEENGLS